MGSLAGTLCVLIVAAFYLVTIREGHDWGDDFSQYIQHAVNLAHGESYTATRYLYNPDNPSIGPRQYPPGFPIALAPVVRVFGVDLQHMKVEEVLFFVAALLLIHQLIQPLMPPAASAAVVLALGFNPVLWDFKDQILSDLPFLFFFFATILCLTRSDEPARSARLRLALSVLGGAAMYASYATRVVGIVLLPSVVMRDFIRHRQLTKETLIAAGSFAALAGLQYLLWTRDTSYTDLLTIDVPVLAANAVSYLRWFTEFWANGYAELPRKMLFLATAGLAVVGYGSLWRQPKAILFAIASLFYLTVIALWPLAQDTRFLIPVLPFYMTCCVLGARVIDRAIGDRIGRRNVVLAMVVAAVASTYIARYTTLPFERLPEGIAKRESVELFDFVKTSSQEDEVFVFSRPRALSFFTGRIVTPPPRSDDGCRLWLYIQLVGAAYIVTGPDASNAEAEYLARFVRDFAPHLRAVMENNDVAVYRVESVPAQCVT